MANLSTEKKLPLCADCGGFDVEWMYRCQKHGHQYCRGCSCPACDEEKGDSYEDYGHDPDLDENNVCRVCGEYEPE